MEQFYKAIDSLCGNTEDNEDTYNDEYEDKIFEETSNVTTRIIEDENITYLKIDSFDVSKYNMDSKILYEFYDEIRDYPNLIIDITNNGGGGMTYFNDLIADLLIPKPITVSTYMLAKGGNNNRFFLQLEYVFW